KQGPEPVFSIKNLLTKPISPSGKPHGHYPAGFSVVGILVRGERVYASDSQNLLRVAERQKDGSYKWGTPVAMIPPKVGGDVFPGGVAGVSEDEVWVCSSRGNSVQLVSLATGQAEQAVSVGVAPYTAVCPKADRCYVTNWGGDPPKEGDPQALSSDTPVRIGPKTGIANHGSVSVLAPVPGRWKQTKT